MKLLNYKGWSKNKFLVITISVVLGSYVMGYILGFAVQEPKEIEVTKEIQKEVPVEVTKEVEKIVEKCTKEAKWEKLKDVDQEIIDLSYEALTIAADSFDAISEFDLDRVANNNEKINAITPKMERATAKRETILNDLGY